MKNSAQNSKSAVASRQELGYHNRFNFPYRSTLSFVPLIEKLEEKANDDAVAEASIIREVLKTVKSIPELLKPIEDLSLLKTYRREVDLLISLVLPSAMIDNSIIGAIIPFQPVTVYASPRFNQLFQAEEDGSWNLGNLDPSKSIRELIAFCGSFILSDYYHFEVGSPGMLKSKELDKLTGVMTFYQPEIISSFVRVVPKKKPKALHEIDLNPPKDDFFNSKFWLSNFPPDTFEIEGLTIYRVYDITHREVVSQLEYTLLNASSVFSFETIREIESKFRVYFRMNDLRLGVAPMLSYHGQMTSCGTDKWFCFIPSDMSETMMENFERSIYARAVEQGKPYLVDDLAALSGRTPIEEELLRQGLRSMIIVPVVQDEELIGAIEIGSPRPNAFTFVSILHLNEILPLISVAFQRAAKDFDTQIQTTIKEHFTSIHSSVEWKFSQVALEKISKSTNGEEAPMPPIDFKDVTPIYGQVDIRNSTEKRNEAIRQDMIGYLTASRDILVQAQKEIPFSILDELIFRTDKYLNKLSQTLDSGDETGILDFIRAEIEPAFTVLSDRNPVLKKTIESFYEALDPEHEHYHIRRKSFEDSLNMINDVVTTILDEEEAFTQKLLPHYFEKYKTDGVEYNIYLGQSILQTGTFDPIFIRNFRLWQLITMVKLARETHRLTPQLSTPLETTQLILCYSNPFAITFRMDEKRFDVAGTYNIRYEIVKKRIDKAHVKGTDERITQPHKIAIIYTQDKEAVEYARYFEYLKSRNLIADEIEYLEVEPLQGLHGLKALRVTVNYEGSEEPHLNYDEEELFRQVKDVMV